MGRLTRAVGAHDLGVRLRNGFVDYREERAAERRLRSLRDLYHRFLQPGDLCFDIGANIGDRTKIFLALGAKTIAIEPQPACAEALRALCSYENPIVIEKALGSAVGTATLYRPEDASTVASMSRDWIDHVRGSGRFELDWNVETEIEVTTLDILVDTYGLPAFCKIDVEGSEPEVIEGLSQPLPALSFEFTPECFDGTVACLSRLHSLGFAEFAFSLGESGVLTSEWKTRARLLAELEQFRESSHVFGDIYARAR